MMTEIKKQIPNLITLGNLMCGVFATGCAAEGKIVSASLLICLGILFDFFDGLAARLLGVSSPLGKELDSLADVVTSGVAPAFILFSFLNGLYPYTHYINLLAFLIPAFAAYRLAKFNLDTRQSHSFLGLPVPSNALLWVGIALSQNTFINLAANGTPFFSSNLFPIFIIVVSLVTDILMISELPMFSLKFNFKNLRWKDNRTQYIFLLGCLAIIVITIEWYAISLIILWYIILSILTQHKQITDAQ
ncbi:MAG: CDP-diacylglycerol--serine O-phosphatidyltransferase [Bacteroidales bacterium]|nr:CDP-diacylglycerol--serine O-phosphatidyltransferase [Bacteroidales bacterium]